MENKNSSLKFADSNPGIFRLICRPKKKAYYDQVACLAVDLLIFFERLREGSFINTALVADYQNYQDWEKDWEIEILEKGPQLGNYFVRLERLNSFKKESEFVLY